MDKIKRNDVKKMQSLHKIRSVIDRYIIINRYFGISYMCKTYL